MFFYIHSFVLKIVFWYHCIFVKLFIDFNIYVCCIRLDSILMLQTVSFKLLTFES